MASPTRAGWSPHFDEDMGAQMDAWFTPAQDFLLGRTTYEIFYASWPKMISDDQVSQKLNFNKKYVASRTLPTSSGRPRSCCRATSGTPSGSSRPRTAGSCRCTARPG